ncbi:MAG: single-stranded-DNA-specific exonuclease RecJ [Anaerolineales bacterium]|nr:MAG: single-stranded-DNA-specific exonuclease RecJ [Anaerolineales bacterium]
MGMLRTWLEPHEVSVPESYWRVIGGNRLVSQVLYSRGLVEVNTAKAFLSPEEYQPAAPIELPNLDQAVRIIQEAIHNNKRIGIWGDFDVDGQTSTTVLVTALKALGGNVIYHIPVRAEESHGISLPGLKKFLKHGLDLIITCDTGISAHEAIDYAVGKQVSVVITDHHDIQESLPNASAIINPKMLPPSHPLSTLPGVGVAYKLLEGLWHHEGKGLPPADHLDLVALGIIADLALLKGDTRYLAQIGLESLRHTKRPGLQSIFELTELTQANITEEHVGFILAPRMNALGRLDDANSMVELLMTQDKGRAAVLALELERLNAQRKLLTDQVYEAAQAQLSAEPRLLDTPVLVLSHPSWPAGVIGIVAARLVEQYHRPVIMLSAPVGEMARGSARSIEGINITQAIAANQRLLQGFGGHPMAAGLSIDPALIPEFRQAISTTIQGLGIEVQKEKDLQIDGYLNLSELSLGLVEDFERLAPFGAGNSPLVFATRNLSLTGYAAVGRNADHLQLTVEDELGYSMRSIWWHGAGLPLPETRFDLAYAVRASTYKGQRDVQIEWVDYRVQEAEAISLQGKKRPIEVVDMRDEADPMSKLNILSKNQVLSVWGEAGARLQVTCFDRFSIPGAENLVIWTIPPGPSEIRAVLDKVKPTRVYLFAINPGMDEPDEFLKRLVGLIKYRIKNSLGRVNVMELAATMAQTPLTIRAGLDWLIERGMIVVESKKGEEICLSEGTNKPNEGFDLQETPLDARLKESKAFRSYYLKADKDRLIISTE